LIRILQFETFKTVVPMRRAVSVLHELPVVAAIKAGLGDIEALALIYSLTLQLAPIAIVALCYTVLPRERKALFLFPLLHYLTCATGAAFVPIAESPTSAAYFWLLLYLVLFARLRGSALGLIGLVALPAPIVNEAMLVFGPMLAFAAGWRARREQTPLARTGLLLLALWFVAAAAYQIGQYVEPHSPAQRLRFIRGMLEGHWLARRGGVNLPMALGLLALLLLAALAWPLHPKRGPARQRWGAIAVVALGAAGIGGLALLASRDMMLSVTSQFAARNNSQFVSIPLAMAAFWAHRSPGWLSPLLMRRTLEICGILAAVFVVYDVHGTWRWTAYLADYRMLLRENRGLVAWEAAVARLPPERRQNASFLMWSWTNPSMSIVFAPAQTVVSIIGNRASYAGWQPFDPGKAEQLPRSRFWTLAPYLRALGELGDTEPGKAKP
jgi:hypothetical protein